MDKKMKNEKAYKEKLKGAIFSGTLYRLHSSLPFWMFHLQMDRLLFHRTMAVQGRVFPFRIRKRCLVCRDDIWNI